MSSTDRPSSLDEARMADVNGETPPEPPPPLDTPLPEPPPTLEERGRPCLGCTETGVVPDPIGNWWCDTCWAARTARIAAALSGRRSTRRPDADPTPRYDPETTRAGVDRILTRFDPQGRLQ